MARTKRRKSTTVRLAVASIAVLGIGAAITTAAWTDQAWFTTSASSAEIELYGALAVDGTCPVVPTSTPGADSPWKAADDGDAAVAIPEATFADLVPGQTRTAIICLWNGSTVPLSVSGADISKPSDQIFVEGSDATITVGSVNELAKGQVAKLDVVATTPNDWPSSYQGKTSGEIAITFTGSTIAS